MNKETPTHRAHAHDGGSQHPVHGPYWTRAHKDWRVWVGAVLMAIALSMFVLSGNLAWAPQYQQQRPAGSTTHD